METKKDKLDTWFFSFSKYVSYKTSLFNSVITFNSVLIASLAIISGINHFPYQIILILFFISSFIPILLVVFLLYNLTETSLTQSNELHRSLTKKEAIGNKHQHKTDTDKNKWKIRFKKVAQKTYIPWSVANFIFFIIIATFCNHHISHYVK